MQDIDRIYSSKLGQISKTFIKQKLLCKTYFIRVKISLFLHLYNHKGERGKANQKRYHLRVGEYCQHQLIFWKKNYYFKYPQSYQTLFQNSDKKQKHLCFCLILFIFSMSKKLYIFLVFLKY